MGSGVCWGNSQRIRLKAQSQANLTQADFVKEIKLIPSDRYLQGLYKTKILLTRHVDQDLPLKIMEEHGYREDKVIISVKGNRDDGFNANLQDEL